MGEALRLNMSLTAVDLSYNNIEDDGCACIAAGIKESGMLVELALSGNLIGDVGARSLARLLRSNGTLTKLELARNKIGDKGAQAIGEAIMARNQEIHALRIGMKFPGQPEPSERKARRLSRSLPLSALAIYAQEKHDYRSGCLPLLHLDLSYNGITEQGSEAMALALKHNPKMKTMDLAGNKMNNGIVAISNALPTNRRLQHLSLSSNNITSKSTQSLGHALQRNYHLRHLTLSDNGIDDAGAAHLMPAVANSHSLRSLDLQYNRICSKGDTNLSEASGTGNLVKMMARPRVDLSSNWSTSFGR